MEEDILMSYQNMHEFRRAVKKGHCQYLLRVLVLTISLRSLAPRGRCDDKEEDGITAGSGRFGCVRKRSESQVRGGLRWLLILTQQMSQDRTESTPKGTEPG